MSLFKNQNCKSFPEDSESPLLNITLLKLCSDVNKTHMQAGPCGVGQIEL